MRGESGQESCEREIRKSCKRMDRGREGERELYGKRRIYFYNPFVYIFVMAILLQKKMAL